MKETAAVRVTLGFCIASLLAGCATSSQIAPASTPQSDAASATAHKQSPMLRGANHEDLIYVNADQASRGGGEVLAYTYPGGRLVGKLGDFDNPGDLCSDTSGNVFVTFGGFEGLNPGIEEYAHGGRGLATLSLPGAWAYACSVDPTTGNLAVTDGANDVYVFQHAQGEPIAYSSGLPNVEYCAYDAAGDLFLAGQDRSEKNQLVEMLAGGSGFQTIKLDKQISPSRIQWDGADLAVQGGPSPTFIYRLSVSQGRAKTVSRVRLVGSGNSEFWISGNTLVRATGARMRIGGWNYPEGGRHRNVTKQALPYQAAGVTVSLGSQRRH